jgi:hypothetical protein
MPTPSRPASKPLPGSPRAAAEGALVYRRQLRLVPRESVLRIAAWVGTLLIHLLVLFMIVLGPAYELEPRTLISDAEALKVRLIDKAPPPVPPVRGTPSRAPVHGRRAASSASPTVVRRRTAPRSSAAPLPPIAVPIPAPPDVKPDIRVAAPAPSVVAKQEQPPRKSSAPPPQPELQPVPRPDQAPPDLVIDTPPPKIVPPAFQPEPVRKPQAEGTEAMPSPPSLAMPPVPVAPSKMAESPPTLVADSVSKPTTAMTLASVPRPEVVETSTPPTPQMESVPRVADLPSAPAPDVRLQTPAVPRETVQMATPAKVSAPLAEREAVPIDDASMRTAIAAPAPTPDAGKLPLPSAVPSRVESVRVTAQAEAQVSADSAADAAAANEPTQASAAPEQQPGAVPASGSANESTMTPGGTDAAVATVSADPGVPTGSDAGKRPTGADGRSTSEASSNGKAGLEPGVATGGEKDGVVGSYIQLKPRGNTDVMNHGRPRVDYRPTRFDDAWTPKGESSVDTALRHAVEKATVAHVFQLPRGVRVKCSLTPLLPMALFHCGGADPRPAAIADAMYTTNAMAPANPLVPPVAPAGTGAVASAPALDNATQCITARVAGGPLPPGCEADVRVRIDVPKAGDSWVPASDQFK